VRLRAVSPIAAAALLLRGSPTPAQQPTPPSESSARHAPRVGLRLQERSGAAVTRVGVGLQCEVRRDVFATVRTDVGAAGHALTLDPRAYYTGVGIALGALTALGPLELSASGRSGAARPRLELSLGLPF
jgi:hypothetical protein